MLDGRIVEMNERDELINHPRHAYTRQLLSAVPETDPRRSAVFAAGAGP
jgi:ABC-type oligopeptide transport system ATPase subunit